MSKQPTGGPHQATAILDSINDGIYTTDTERRITYWSRSAERITGWQADEVVGRCCRDSILCHVDRHGRTLCRGETCPLYRSILTGKRSEIPIVVYASGKDRERIPMQVSVGPMHGAEGNVNGAVEVFRDMSGVIRDLEQAKAIQNESLRNPAIDDPRVQFAVHYLPAGILGGDFYAVEAVDSDRYAFVLADVMGHGVSAALQTMYLRSLVEECRHLMPEPVEFLRTLNDRLYNLVHGNRSFATAIFGLVNVNDYQLELACAGQPPPFLFRKNGEVETLSFPGNPLGIFRDIRIGNMKVQIHPGDRLFAYTDGATEVADKDRVQLGEKGLLKILVDLGASRSEVRHKAIEEALLKHSDGISFEDDLSFLEVIFPATSESVA